MNIEQKNTLFVTSLILVVLLGVGAVAFLLVKDHVTNSIKADLERAHDVFVQAQKNRFESLVTVARGVRAEPSLIAATLTGDIETMRGMLDDFFPRPGIDFVAVYLGTGPGGVVGAGNRPHFSSPQILNSKLLTGMVGSLVNGNTLVFGNALLYDALLQIVVVPIDNPLGGRVGALLVGRQFTETDLNDMRKLVHTDMAIFSGNSVLASSIVDLGAELHLLSSRKDLSGVNQFSVKGVIYSGRVVTIPSQLGVKDRIANVLIAAPHMLYWLPYRILGKSALFFSALILLLAALVGITVSRRNLTNPLKLLAIATKAIASGDYNQNVLIKRDDEIGQLTDSFNSMLSALNSSHLALEKSRQRFRNFADSSSDWLWETDGEGRYTYVSSSVSNTMGIHAEKFKGHKPTEVFPDSHLEELMALLLPSNDSNSTFKDIEIWLTTPNTDRHCLRLNGVPITGNDNTFQGYRGTARDITKLKQDEKRMLVLANQDHLTGVSNRRRFLRDLGNEISRLEACNESGVLLLIDLDHLKLVNDTAGHAAGDQIIVQVAGMLKRASSDQDLLARISGDEFAIACAGLSEQQGTEKARMLLESINTLRPRYGGRALNISASIGVVNIPKHGNHPVDLLAKADAAMSKAKQAGRNRIMIYDLNDTTRERMDSQLVWKDRLIDALENNGLLLMYQPILSVETGTVSHYEVLVRMHGDKDTYIPPDKFIPTAEQFGLIQRVDSLVVSKAIRSLAKLSPEQNNIGFSINLSGLSVGDDDIYSVILKELQQTGVNPERVTFEITETAACEQLNSAVEFIERIRRLGCKVSLDDFGVGFSSFSYLKHLRADILKIDGSFIRDIHNNSADQLFVKALVDVARGMGMRTIAEFVENQKVYEHVKGLGVDYVQGYYLGRPSTKLLNSNPVVTEKTETEESCVVAL